MAQRLFDRIMFIAFCEDRKLLPEKTIPKAAKVAGFHRVTNPKWQSFKNLFQLIDEGEDLEDIPDEERIPKYNGGLFAKHAVDELRIFPTSLDRLLQHDRRATTSPTKSISTCWATCSSVRSRNSKA